MGYFRMLLYWSKSKRNEEDQEKTDRTLLPWKVTYVLVITILILVVGANLNAARLILQILARL